MSSSKTGKIGIVILIVLLAYVAAAGICGAAESEMDTPTVKSDCKPSDQKWTGCDVQGTVGDGKVTVTCYSTSGGSVSKPCSRVYTPVFGETRTGLRGFYWQCGDAVIHENSLGDKKYVCAQACGFCPDKRE